VFAPPKIPWQVTGNHWVSVPCIHPADGAIHGLGVVVRRLRGAVEFAGGADFIHGANDPLLRIGLEVNGQNIDLSTTRMAWQRISEWIPAFTTTVGDLTIRGTIFGPYGRGIEMPGVVYALSLENRGATPLSIRLTSHGVLGLRQHRIRTARPLDDEHTYIVGRDTVTLSGTSAFEGVALAIGVDGGTATAERRSDGAVTWAISQQATIAANERFETAVYLAAAPERDGAMAALEVMRLHGWKSTAEATRNALASLEQTTGVLAADRLVNRNLMFAYFFAVARAIDDGQVYLVRTRSPWNSHGLTVRDWDALMWTIPAIQLADPDFARELILRMCEVHGYAPGRGVNYLDGVPFQVAFSIDGAAAYVIAVDRYIAQTGDDRVVEEHVIADTLYASYEDISARRDETKALYATEHTASGRVEFPYVLHSNAVVAYALDIFKQTLDEKSAEKVEPGDIVRAAIKRFFAVEIEGSPSGLAAAIDLQGGASVIDDPVGSAYWLPLYDMLSRNDSSYRRTVKRLIPPDGSVAAECARLLGPDGDKVLDRLRRIPMDNGVAAEQLDEQGNAVANGGDAALSGLVAYSVWYAVHALGVRP
jgi:hypothetical protein